MFTCLCYPWPVSINGLNNNAVNLAKFALQKGQVPAGAVPTGAAAPEAQAPAVNGDGNYNKGDGNYNDFANRDGYDPSFLGEELPMPKLSMRLQSQAAPLLNDPTNYELKYHNFSVMQHAGRATPIITAVNVDGAQYKELDRKGSWVFDGRIARQHQMGNEAYKNNDFDRGHLVRRKDAQWGSEAAKASSDTFVYTNSALQHADFNQKTWLDLENNVFFGAVANKEKKTIFTGPVLRDDDPKFDNGGKMKNATQIPTAFWKVQVWKDKDAGLQAEAFVMSQEELVKGEAPSRPPLGSTPPPLKTFRVSMETLEQITDIDFGDLADGPDRTESDKKAIADAGIIINDKPWLKNKSAPQATVGAVTDQPPDVPITDIKL